jgi:hypothetical protein
MSILIHNNLIVATALPGLNMHIYPNHFLYNTPISLNIRGYVTNLHNEANKNNKNKNKISELFFCLCPRLSLDSYIL